MFRKDYIDRHFEEFGKVMALIFGYRKTKDWERFEAELHEAFRRFAPMKISEVENLEPAGFETKMAELAPDQQKILAALLFEELMRRLEDNHASHANLRAKCLKLYQLVASGQTMNEFDLDVHYKLEFLQHV